jgi:hypothetical protein
MSASFVIIAYLLSCGARAGAMRLALKEFIKFLSSPAAAVVIKAKGMEPAAP